MHDSHPGSERRFSIADAFRLWFTLTPSVGRRAYFASGVFWMVVKYALEAWVIHATTGIFYSPFVFLSPFGSIRAHALQQTPEWLGLALILWSLPFMWIGVSMSVRRAADAGGSPWWGLVFFVPGLHYLLMLLLSILSSASKSRWKPAQYGSTTIPGTPLQSGTLVVIGICAPVGLAMQGISVYGFGNYGIALFFGTPFLIGAVTAFILGRAPWRTFGSAFGIVTLCLFGTGAVFLLTGLEGAICLLMAAPIILAIGWMGAALGWGIARCVGGRMNHVGLLLLVLPFLAAAESRRAGLPVYEVVSAVEIDAPPERVWEYVIGFTEIPPPPQWYFRLGIAYPVRARLEGAGVGAVRYCEFSTGPFVEPITVWDPPRRLSFDVLDQPPSMHELSPYRDIHPPHLDGVLRSLRGEFRLIPLPGSRTRLEGSTWYVFDMHPQAYWTLWSDLSIRRIHQRVLLHVKRLAEDPDGGKNR